MSKQMLFDWIKNHFVKNGVVFELVLIGEYDTEEFNRKLYSVKYDSGEFAEGVIFEARRNKVSNETNLTAYDAYHFFP
jgi:hypothetical protein